MARAANGAGAAFIESTLASACSECVEWPFGTGEGGYSRGVEFRGLRDRAHRHVCRAAHGESDLQALHKCNNPPCINPLHLYWGTPKQNYDDAVAVDAYAARAVAKGERVNTAKLTESDVIEIRKSDLPEDILALIFGCSESNIGYIRRRETWKHVA